MYYNHWGEDDKKMGQRKELNKHKQEIWDSTGIWSGKMTLYTSRGSMPCQYFPQSSFLLQNGKRINFYSFDQPNCDHLLLLSQETNLFSSTICYTRYNSHIFLLRKFWTAIYLYSGFSFRRCFCKLEKWAKTQDISYKNHSFTSNSFPLQCFIKR